MPPMAVPRRRSAWLTVGLPVLTALLLVGVIGLFGGWESASAQREDTLPAIPPGQEITVEPFELTAIRAGHTMELEPVLRAEDGVRRLILTMEVTITTDSPLGSGTLKRAVTLEAPGLRPSPNGQGPGLPGNHVVSENVLRVVDSLSSNALQPGLTQRLAFVWLQDSQEPVPDSLTFTLHQHTYRTSYLEPTYSWFDPEPVATVTLPVVELGEP